MTGPQLYSRAIKRVPRLEAEEEQSLARRYRDDGSTDAAHRLISAHLVFVAKVALEYRSCGVELADLIQEGSIGLMRAVDRFDPEKGIRLLSYAVWWIRAYILNHILSSYSLVRLGKTQAQRKLFFALARTRSELGRTSAGHGPDSNGALWSLLAKRLNVKASEAEEMAARMDGRDLSLDAPRGPHGDASAGDLLRCGAPPADEELGEAQELSIAQEHIEEALTKLDRRERHIIERRFLADEPGTLKDLADHFGLSSERTRQLEARAKSKLRHHLQGLATELGWPVRSARRTAPDGHGRGRARRSVQAESGRLRPTAGDARSMSAP